VKLRIAEHALNAQVLMMLCYLRFTTSVENFVCGNFLEHLNEFTSLHFCFEGPHFSSRIMNSEEPPPSEVLVREKDIMIY
jgi:hypothetical protein